MILSDISVKRPVFASVISLILIAFGILSFEELPLREYPDVNPPVVSIETLYPGASAKVVETKITRLIEGLVSSIEGIKAISSSSKDGESEITIEFKLSRDIDAAANDVRDRVSRVIEDLPEEVTAPEISKVDSNTGVMMWLNLSSSSMDQMALTDYADRYLVDRLSVVDGVARIRIGGGRRYAMRIWLDRVAMAARNITVSEIENALRAENVELPAGRIESDMREFTVRTERLYRTADDFSKLVVKRGEDGYLVRLRDVADVAVGPEDERSELRGNGEPMIGLGVVKQSTANTLAVARGIQEEVKEIAPFLPEGTTIENSYDTSVFIDAAINEVYFTLGVAIILVIGVIYVFLGSVRAMLIPAMTVPVSLIASFIALSALGFSINLFTLLALVLAIGLVVDDAIVVLENIFRRIENGEPPLLAAYNGARQVGFAVIATTLVLIAVFVPIAFLEGNIGRLFTEFALTIASAVAFSSLIALTLSPMMCSKLLKKTEKKPWFNRKVDAFFDNLSRVYRHALVSTLRKPMIMIIAFLGISSFTYILGTNIPQEYAPQEDRGVFFVIMQAPEGASYKYSSEYMRKIEQDMMPLLEKNEATRVLARVPANFGNSAEVNSGIGIVILNSWDKRERSAGEITGELFGKFMRHPGIMAFPIMPQGLGQSSRGKPVQIVLGGTSYTQLMKWRDIVMEHASKNPGLQGLDSDYKETKPQMRVEIDRDRAAELGVSLLNIGQSLETMLGSKKVTTYIDGGEEYDVILQAKLDDRETPQDLQNIYVRSDRTGKLIPLSNLVTVSEFADAAELNRYNRLRAITIEANLAPGYSLGEALDFLENIARTKLPEEAQIDFKGTSREFKESGSSLYFTFALALLIVYLVLAAQFESFVHPFIIMLTVPIAITGALFGLYAIGSTLNIYSQIGIIMLVGLAAKNGILIVEFANQLRDDGMRFGEALVEAATTRFRPVLMTALSTSMGAIPLLLASGAGAESRLTIGIVVFFGVIFATAFTIFIVPVFYKLMARGTDSPETITRELERLQEVRGPIDQDV